MVNINRPIMEVDPSTMHKTNLFAYWKCP